MSKVKLNKKEFAQIVSNVAKTAINERVKELGLDDVDARFAKYPAQFIGKTTEELDAMDRKDRVVEFVKAVVRRDLNHPMLVKALSGGVGSEGGFQVPEEFAAEINRIAEDFGVVRALSRRVPMARDTMNMPRLASAVSVTFPGENTAGTESDPVWENVQLLAKTAVGLTVTSNELLADANISIVDLLATLFAEALAGEEDSQGLAGTGAPFTGLLTETGVNEVTQGATLDAFTDIKLEDLRSMQSSVKPLALRNAVYVMHRDIWNLIAQLADTAGQFQIAVANPVLMSGDNAGPGAQGGNLWNYPVWLSDKMPALGASAASTPYVAFGSFDHFWFGDRQSMAIDISNSATVGANDTFAANQAAIRVTERIALAVGLPDAFARLVTAA